ncbi:uncharacterized protein BP5553_00132 [Venustampulla echinocandica]|uniref:EKC/KEOPS complex subunit BUD32 n=1 Tax=Venustampulla echinocandica TaxID=2656787 RepID=A0A370TXB3_9HELO|nr:uncharacterized protein BP5553_00132 [Venustampulla echinocandica]RDL40153.1 hypothetical protein BP5553_00132 [Venustampulla echinocandica]
MIAPLSRWLLRLGRQSPSPPRSYLNQNFEQIGEGQMIEEEHYLVISLHGSILVRRHVALKVFIRSRSLSTEAEHELNMYKRLDQGSSKHSGRDALRRLSVSFKISGPDGKRQCLVNSPLWHNMRTFLAINPAGRLPKPVLLATLQRLFIALDYMHNECNLIHTDVSATNIMFGFIDDLDPAFAEFEEENIRSPSPRKEVDGRFIYVSRDLGQPKGLGLPVLCDLGNVVDGQVKHIRDIQPDVYRSPEMILGISWSYGIDIWNVGFMRASAPSRDDFYASPPLELIARGGHREKFFTEEGVYLESSHKS